MVHTPLTHTLTPLWRALPWLGRGRSPARPSQGCGVLIIAGAGAGPGGGGAGAPPHPRPSPLPAGAGGSRQAAGDGFRTPPRRSGARSGAEEAAAPGPRGARCRPAGPWTPAAPRPAARRSTRTRYRGCGGPAPVPRPGGLWGFGSFPAGRSGGCRAPSATPQPLAAVPGGGGRGRRERPEPRPGLARIELFLALESLGSGQRPAVTSQLRVKLGQGGWQGGGDPRRAVSPGWGMPWPWSACCVHALCWAGCVVAL